MSGLVPRTESAVLGALPCATSDVRDSRAHGGRMRMDDLSAPFERFVARVSASTVTVDCRSGLVYHPPPTSLSLRFLLYPQGATRALAEASTAATIVAQHAPLPTNTLLGEYSAAITDPATSAPPPPGNLALLNILPPSGRISTRTRRRTAAAVGIAPLAPRFLLLNISSGPAGPLDHPSGVLSPRREPHGRDRPHPSL